MAGVSQIDERTRAAALEAELAAERAQFGLAERAARFGYWRVRLADNHTIWSPGMYRLLNISESQPPDMKWLLSQVMEEDVAHLNEAIAAAIKSRSPFYYRTRPRDPSNPAYFVDTHGEVDVGPDGMVTSIVGVCHDVTKQVIAEEARAKAETKYRIMTEQASDIIMLHSVDGQVLFASNALERVLGHTAQDIEKNGFMHYVHPEDREEASKLAARPLPGQTLTATYRARHADGHYMWLEGSTRGVYDEETGELRHVIGVSRDICQRKADEMKMRAAQENAEAASRAKSGFLASMSHELRTPLNAIIGFSDIMREEMFGALGNDRYSEYAGLIRDSGQLLLELISDILDMAKIEAGKTELNFDSVDIAETIEDSARLLAQRARENGVQIIMEVPEAGLPLTADRRAVKQILLNLLSNAIKFTPRGGHVWISARQDSEHVVLIIRDDGFGIPAEALPRLGRAFEQVSRDPMIAKDGTGLGLALVRALSEKHGGAMQIESTEGHGTTVTVTLALNPPIQSAEAA